MTQARFTGTARWITPRVARRTASPHYGGVAGVACVGYSRAAKAPAAHPCFRRIAGRCWDCALRLACFPHGRRRAKRNARGGGSAKVHAGHPEAIRIDIEKRAALRGTGRKKSIWNFGRRSGAAWANAVRASSGRGAVGGAGGRGFRPARREEARLWASSRMRKHHRGGGGGAHFDAASVCTAPPPSRGHHRRAADGPALYSPS